MAINRYDPFHEALSLRRAMDELFAQSFVNPSWGRSSQQAYAPMDIHETEQGYEVKVAMPGVKPEDIDVTIEQNTLTVRGHYHASTQHEQGQNQPQQGAAQQQRQAQGPGQRHGNYLMREISSGSFERMVTFDRPIDPDNIQTHYEHGILTLTLPISAASRPRKISVSSPKSQSQQVTVDAGSASAAGTTATTGTSSTTGTESQG